MATGGGGTDVPMVGAAAGGGAIAPTEGGPSIRELENKVKELEAKNATLEGELDDMSPDNPAYKLKFMKYEKNADQIASLNIKIAATRQEIAARINAGTQRLHISQRQSADGNMFERLMQPFMQMVKNEFKNELGPVRAALEHTQRKILVPWESESMRTQRRDPEFKKRLTNYYQTDTCQVLTQSLSKSNPRVIGAHIWKFATRGNGLEHFGLEHKDVESPRNGLLLAEPIEQAFDRMQVCFLYNFLHDRFVLFVADPELLKEPTKRDKRPRVMGETTFATLDGADLVCPPGRLPFRRLLSWHAYNVLKKYGKLKEVDEQMFSSFRYHRASDPSKFPDAVDSGRSSSDDASAGGA